MSAREHGRSILLTAALLDILSVCIGVVMTGDEIVKFIAALFDILCVCIGVVMTEEEIIEVLQNMDEDRDNDEEGEFSVTFEEYWQYFSAGLPEGLSFSEVGPSSDEDSCV